MYGSDISVKSKITDLRMAVCDSGSVMEYDFVQFLRDHTCFIHNN
jgi:hypothetical protein